MFRVMKTGEWSEHGSRRFLITWSMLVEIFVTNVSKISCLLRGDVGHFVRFVGKGWYIFFH